MIVKMEVSLFVGTAQRRSCRLRNRPAVTASQWALISAVWSGKKSARRRPSRCTSETSLAWPSRPCSVADAEASPRQSRSRPAISLPASPSGVAFQLAERSIGACSRSVARPRLASTRNRPTSFTSVSVRTGLPVRRSFHWFGSGSQSANSASLTENGSLSSPLLMLMRASVASMYGKRGAAPGRACVVGAEFICEACMRMLCRFHRPSSRRRTRLMLGDSRLMRETSIRLRHSDATRRRASTVAARRTGSAPKSAFSVTTKFWMVRPGIGRMWTLMLSKCTGRPSAPAMAAATRRW